MAQTTDEFTKEKERAVAEAALIRAQADLLKAQGELSAAKDPPDPLTAQTNAAKAQADALKALADSQKALSDSTKAADLAAAQARVGSVTGLTGGPTGAVTAKTDAGKAEATLLSAKATGTAATRIAETLNMKVKGKRVVLVSGTDTPQFANYHQFSLRADMLQSALTSADAVRQAAEAKGDALMAQAAAARAQGQARATASSGTRLEAVPALTTAGAVLDALTKLGSYFQTDYELGGIGLTPDREQLLVAVGGALANGDGPVAVLVPNRGVQKIGQLSALLATQLGAATQLRQDLLRLQQKSADAKAKAANETAANRKKLYEEAAAAYDSALQPVIKASAQVDDLITSLGVADANGVMVATKVLQEKAVYDEVIKPNTRMVLLDVRSAVGGYYTKKNVWTFLGSMPFYAMGGTVVTWWLIDPTGGGVDASGQLAIHSGYRKVNQVESLFK